MDPVCFVIMPFGTKPDPSGGTIDFDRVYESALEPGICDAGLLPVRADMEQTGGIIHKEMFERLVLADYAIADLTTANANVFYEVGVRHAVRPRTTLPLVASHHRIPFDLTFLRALPYELGPDNVFGEEHQAALRQAVADRLVGLRDLAAGSDTAADSPLFQLLSGWQAAPIAHLKTDVFRDQVEYREMVKGRLRDIRDLAASPNGRGEAAQMLDALRAELDVGTAEVGVLVDLLLTERALGRWDQVVEVAESFPAEVRRQVLVREQTAMALGRMAEDASRPAAERTGLRRRAIEVLHEVLAEHGPSAETLGLLGRAHKAAWLEAQAAGSLSAESHLRDAIDAYVRGFKVDPRDAYPGINAVTLLAVSGQPDDEALLGRLLPVVRFAAEEQIAARPADYWSWATLAELSAIAGDITGARRELGRALSRPWDGWMLHSTAQNLDVLANRPAAAPELADLARELRAQAG